MPDIKQTFVQRALQDYMQQVEAAMKVAIVRNKVGVTGEGAASLSHKTIQSGNGALGELSFAEYLRFIDMGVGRAHPLGGVRATSLKLQTSKEAKFALEKDKVRKPKKIYSKVAYGKLNYLIGKLMYGYTEEAVAALKEELEKSNTP